MGSCNEKTPGVQNAPPGFAVSPAGKLPLPLPDYLDIDEQASAESRDLLQFMGALLDSRLSDSAAILPDLSVRAALSSVTAGLTHKQRAYDDYFDVERYQGGSSITLHSMVPVLDGLAAELHAGSSLTDEDIDRLMDGLRALLETLGGSLCGSACVETLSDS